MVVPKNSFSHLEPTYLEVAIKANIAGILVDHLDGLSPDIGTNADIHPEKLGQSVCFLATKNCLKKVLQLSSSIYLPLNMNAVRKDISQNKRLSSQLARGSYTPLRLLLACQQG